MEGVFEIGLLPTAPLHIQEAAGLPQTAYFDHRRQWPREGIENPVDDNRVKFVGELARRAIALVVRNFPADIEFSLDIGSSDGDGHPSTLGKQMDREAREHRLSTQDTERCLCGLLGCSLSG